MGRRPKEHPGSWIVIRFAITSLLVFVLIGLVISWLRTRDLRAHEEDSAKSRAQLVADEVIAPFLRSDPPSGPLSGKRYDQVNQLVKQIQANDPGIVRVKIWSRDGTVLYSNDPDQVGMTLPPEDDLKEAFEGQAESDISDLTKPENAGERRLASKLFETYVPVRWSPTAPVAMVVEVYRDYSGIQAEIDRLANTLAVSLGIGLLVLYILLLPLMVSTTRRLRQQNDQLTAQATQLGELLEREQETVAELRELDRMKDDFVSASSHELRSPLTSILGYAGILRSRIADDAVAHEAVDAIERQGARMLRLVMNLLTESRLEADRSEVAADTFEVLGLLREVASDFHAEGGRILIEATPGAEARSDRVKVADILVNLVDNALKYGDAESVVTVSGEVSQETLSLHVTDHGPGIDPGDVPRIFDRFYQADQSSTRSHGGVGLGLHIVKGLVDMMGGTIAVRSAPGEGAEFTVSLPMVPAAVPAQTLNA